MHLFHFHHNWATWENHLTRTFPLIKDHVLLSQATNLKEVAKEISALLTKDKIEEIVNTIPEDWLQHESDDMTSDEMRTAYITYLQAKLAMIDSLVKEAENAR